MTLVPAIGPQPCDLLFVGLCPGHTEAALGEPFVGKSGQELARFLTGDLIPEREHVRICNLVPHRPKSGKEVPSAAEITHWIPALQAEVGATRPFVVAPLGLAASRVFLGSAFTLERGHGLAHRLAFPIPSGAGPGLHLCLWVLPCYHPAAALHAPELQSYFAADMEALGVGLAHGFTKRPEDTTATTYIPLPVAIEIPAAFSIDTEGWPDAPWCLTISWETGVAYFVDYKNSRGLAQVRDAVSTASRVTCHSLLADLDVLAALDIHIPDAAMDDTLVMAYNLALEPQALKALAHRHLGAEQDSYQDIIRDAEESMVRGYVECTGLTHADPRVVKACARVLTKIDDGADLRPAKEIWSKSKFSQVVDPIPRVTLDLVPKKVAIHYACRDADLTERLRPQLYQRIADRGLTQVYEHDIGVLPIVNQMQRIGMEVDLTHFDDLITLFGQAYAAVRAAIETCVGVDVNPNSGPQVSALLFDTLGLPRTRSTKGGSHYTTEDKYLEAMRDLHPVLPLLIDARELTKLQGSYVALILKHAREVQNRWLLFPHLRITRVVSGRVSAFDPNVLAIPKHSKRGKLIRHGFVAGAGRTLVSNDLSQIELRVLAHESQDAGMCKVYREGGDLHADLGEKIFGLKPADQDPSLHRLPCKTINFSLVMGAQAQGLKATLGKAGLHWTLKTCEEFINETWKARPGVAAYIDAQHTHARRYGYVKDFCGRRRYVAGVSSSSRWIRLEAERQAQATPIQAGAQEVFKAWMARVWREVLVPRQQRGVYAEPWLQVHDDLICVSDQAEAHQLGKEIRAVLPQLLRVPVTAGGVSGARWSELT